MSEPQVTLDPNSLDPIEDKLRGPLEDQLTSALQAATDKIRRTYAGESVDEVTQMLLDGTRVGLHPDIAEGFRPNPAELRHVAEANVAGH
jgi:hypothetical protein